MQRLILFDVDQTLISTRGGDRKALNDTFRELHGIDDAFEGISFGGRMDLSIMGQVYSHWGVAEGDRSLGDFKARYFELLEQVLKDWEMGIVYPGIPELLRALDSRAGVQLGLATGNFRESAFIKLRKYGLDTFFKEGGFGGDHPNRPEGGSRRHCQMSGNLGESLRTRRYFRHRGLSFRRGGRSGQRHKFGGGGDGSLRHGEIEGIRPDVRIRRPVGYEEGVGGAADKSGLGRV